MKKTKLEKNFEQIFNLPESKPLSKEIEILKPQVKGNDELDTDFKYARENLYNIIERGSEAMGNLLEVAEQSQSARAYEVLSQIIKTLTDANKDLLEIHKKNRSIRQEEKSGPKNVTNALFVGTTTELQRLLKDTKNTLD